MINEDYININITMTATGWNFIIHLILNDRDLMESSLRGSIYDTIMRGIRKAKEDYIKIKLSMTLAEWDHIIQIIWSNRDPIRQSFNKSLVDTIVREIRKAGASYCSYQPVHTTHHSQPKKAGRNDEFHEEEDFDIRDLFDDHDGYDVEDLWDMLDND